MARPRSAPSPLWALQQSPHPPLFIGPRRGCPPRCPPGPLSEIEGVFVLEIPPPPKCVVKSSCFLEATLTTTSRHLSVATAMATMATSDKDNYGILLVKNVENADQRTKESLRDVEKQDR